MAETVEAEGLILTRQWWSRPEGLQLELWAATEHGPVHVRFHRQRAIMFVERGVPNGAGERRQVALQTLDGRDVDALYFPGQRELVAERERIWDAGHFPHEADVKPVERFLMERFITGALRVRGVPRRRGRHLSFDDPEIAPSDCTPPLRLLSIDIETDGLEGALLSIAAVGEGGARVFVVGEPPRDGATRAEAARQGVEFVPGPREAIAAFLARVAEVDPDVILGWNVIEFDLRYLADACAELGMPFALGRGGGRAAVLAPRSSEQPYVARVPGRVVLDGIATLRSATYQFERYALQYVAQALLGRGKAIDTGVDPVEEIRRMAREAPLELARYNAQDCQLVLDIASEARLVEFAVERQHLTGLPMDRQGGSVAAFDQLYLPRLHRRGVVAPSVGFFAGAAGESPGGHVMDSEPGLYHNVLVLDFKSLYPSIIRSFCIDPLGLAQPGDDPVEGFDGATFAREGHILPALVGTLWEARDRAKRDGNAAMSRAIKIMMNSFYGVLGTPGCRFFDPRLVSSITRRGHEIIRRTRTFMERQGLRVIYGDTDSLFVLLGEGPDEATCRERGEVLSEALNAHWSRELSALGLQSYLELEFETHYLRFLMPTMRGSDLGSKKRYAGAVRREDGSLGVVVRGLEAVRTDWTPLARRFQLELLHLVFTDAPVEPYVRETVAALRRGAFDDELVYTRRLRRPVDAYGKGAPPPVQAARMLGGDVRQVRYLMTRRGPVPLSLLDAPPDYDHYVDRQLAPAADSVLQFLGTSFERIAGSQLSLF